MRITIVNLYYPPDLAPSGYLTASLAEHRAGRGDDVTVITGTGSYVAGSRGSDPHPNQRQASARPRIIRLWTPSLGRQSVARRLGDYGSFFAGALIRLASLPEQDVVIALTSPPYILAAAVAHRLLHRRTRVVLWSHDVYPDAAEALGSLRPGGMTSRALRWIKRRLLRHVDHVVAVDPAMLERVVSGYASGRELRGSVIPTWEPAALFPAGHRPPTWREYDAPDLAGRFIVLHLGNLGFGHRIDTIADVATRLAGEAVTFLFVGGGVRYPELARVIERRGLDNVRFRDYVPRDETPQVLAGAGCTFISLDDRSLGIMSPCKLNGSLAMGLPVVYAGPQGTNVDEAITRYGCGFSQRHGRVEELADAIRRLRGDRAFAADMSRKARRAFDEDHSDLRGLARFDALIEELVGREGETPADDVNEPGAGRSR